MCDTLGMIKNGWGYFAKNSDRSPNEIQVLEYYPARTGLSGQLDVTYTSLPQAAETHAVLLSRPAWMWGAEMGVNDCGICIGNEAVFTRGKYGKTGLTGMDMVRLALERSSSAAEARDLLIALLEQHEQGGNCGFDHDFYYDNSFLVMDRHALFVLETAGRQWVWKQYESTSISNRLSIGSEGDAYSGGAPYDFKKKHLEPVYSTFSGSASRRSQTQCSLQTASTLEDCFRTLSTHDASVQNPFAQGCVSSTCMHYGGLVGDHTTSSMVVELQPGRTIVWSTGCSTPCVSLFKPWLFGTEPAASVYAPFQAAEPVTAEPNNRTPETACGPEANPEARAYWLQAEAFRRSLLGKALPQEFYAERDQIQHTWTIEARRTSDAEFPAFSACCLAQEQAFYEKWSKAELPPAPSVSSGFLKRWQKKNAVLEKK